MERTSRAPVATFYAPGAWERRVVLDDARGASRDRASSRASATSSASRAATGAARTDGSRSLGKRELAIECDVATTDLVRARPYVELWAPVGDRDRMLLLAEKAVELGVSAWRSVSYRRSRERHSARRGRGVSARSCARA